MNDRPAGPAPAPPAAARPRREEGLAWREVEGRVVILPTGGAELVRLNPTGSCLWVHLDGETPVERLVEHVAEEFGVEPDRAHRDVLHFLAELRAAGLVTWD